ncbi:MAG: bL35 family ribosomal protein [Alphaproteobacteria bacterium]
MAKVKMKTRRAAAKRFKKSTANGKILRSIRNHGHFLSRRGHHKAAKLAGTTYVNDSNYAMVNKLVPALGAKKKRTKFLKRMAAAKVAAAQAQA